MASVVPAQAVLLLVQQRAQVSLERIAEVKLVRSQVVPAWIAGVRIALEQVAWTGIAQEPTASVPAVRRV